MPPPLQGTPVGPEWVDGTLLAGPDHELALVLEAPVDRGRLRTLVADWQRRLTDAGLRQGGALALRLPPSVTYVAALLAGWRIGAQVSLLDHRLTDFEVDAALRRVGAQFVIRPARPAVVALTGFQVVEDATIVALDGGTPAPTPHAVIQFSSGSTGPSKVIGRTADDLLAELDRYRLTDGVPRHGDRMVLLASMVHVLGLVGGLLHCLHARVPMTIPRRLTIDGILAAIGADPAPTTVIGVPAHLELLAAVHEPPALPQFHRLTTAGELPRPDTITRFTDRYPTILGNMYGMTEVGVIATDLFGQHRPAVHPAPGIEVRVVDGELQVARPFSPYVGLVDESRWADGWLRTRDAATLDPATGLFTVQGRLDSQVAIGGLKVDLTEVEQLIGALPGVTEVVVGHTDQIEVFLTLGDQVELTDVQRGAAERLAPYKRPRRWQVLDALPRTTSGKLVRDTRVLRAAAGAA